MYQTRPNSPEKTLENTKNYAIFNELLLVMKA
jgi:hypothetical protein